MKWISRVFCWWVKSTMSLFLSPKQPLMWNLTIPSMAVSLRSCSTLLQRVAPQGTAATTARSAQLGQLGEQVHRCSLWNTSSKPFCWLFPLSDLRYCFQNHPSKGKSHLLYHKTKRGRSTSAFIPSASQYGLLTWCSFFAPVWYNSFPIPTDSLILQTFTLRYYFPQAHLIICIARVSVISLTVLFSLL